MHRKLKLLFNKVTHPLWRVYYKTFESPSGDYATEVMMFDRRY